MELFHISNCPSKLILKEGLTVSKARDGKLYFSPSIAECYKWYISLKERRPESISLWKLELKEQEIEEKTHLALTYKKDIPPQNLTLVYEGDNPPWQELNDGAPLPVSVWHKDTPETFWERMRMIHGEDVGP